MIARTATRGLPRQTVVLNISLPALLVTAVAFSTGESQRSGQPRGPQNGPVPYNLFQTWNFDAQPPGGQPPGFSAYALGGGKPATWSVQGDPGAPSPPNMIMQSMACPTAQCVQLLLVDDLVYEYPDVSVRIRLADPTDPGGSGAAGVIVGARDRQNFYTATVDLVHARAEVNRVVEGDWTVMADAPVTLKKLPWHVLHVRRNTIISKEYIEVAFDGVPVISVEDTLMSPGQIGLVTRGSLAVAFDNLNASPLYSQKPLSPPAAY